ncbi:MAG: amino acid transporter [Candidatus Puniceispirillum sp.]|nr:amino acid transporter [Candidatus Puniceispirillum sp.]
MLAALAPYAGAFLTIASIQFMATITPGPDFVLVLRNSLSYSKRSGLFTALGSASGMVFHGSYTLLGVGILVQQSPLIFNGVRVMGALYLMYIGWRSIQNPSHVEDSFNVQKDAAVQDLTRFQAWRMGFLSDALNPIVIGLFLTIFSSVMTGNTPPFIQAMFVAEAALISLTWFCFVALCFSYPLVQNLFKRTGVWLDRTAGAVLILLGLMILWSVWT